MRITLAVWPFRPCARYHYHYRRHHHAAPHRRTIIPTSPRLATTGDHPTPPPRWSWHNVMKPVAPSPSPPPVAHRINTSGGLGDATVTLVGRRPKTRRTGERTGRWGGIRHSSSGCYWSEPSPRPATPPPRKAYVRACTSSLCVTAFFTARQLVSPHPPRAVCDYDKWPPTVFFFRPTRRLQRRSPTRGPTKHTETSWRCAVCRFYFLSVPRRSLYSPNRFFSVVRENIVGLTAVVRPVGASRWRGT